jgi:hypothetical protein
MISPEPSAPLPKRLKLHFFPASFPDETLYSRVSRYHLLTGEQKDETTFVELFEQEGLKVNFAGLVPGTLATLASLLPGDSLVQLGNILSQNTFVPLVVPVLTSTTDAYHSFEFGEARSCLICLKEDELLFGSTFLHKSHQLPAVTACWKHGTKLIDACPHCTHPFKRPGKFLRAPLTPCGCGWNGASDRAGSPSIEASEGEQHFAVYAHGVLHQRTHRTSIAVLVRFFQMQIEKTNYKIEPTGEINRRLLVGMISAQLAGERTAAEVAKAAAEVLASAKKAVWWYGDILSCSNRSLRQSEADNQRLVSRRKHSYPSKT